MPCLWLPKTFWLSLTNAVLGAAIVLCILVIVAGLLCGSISAVRRRRHYRTELDRDLEEIFGAPHPGSGPSPAAGRPGILAHFCACVRTVIAPLKRWRPFHRRV